MRGAVSLALLLTPPACAVVTGAPVSAALGASILALIGLGVAWLAGDVEDLQPRWEEPMRVVRLVGYGTAALGIGWGVAGAVVLA